MTCELFVVKLFIRALITFRLDNVVFFYSRETNNKDGIIFFVSIPRSPFSHWRRSITNMAADACGVLKKRSSSSSSIFTSASGFVFTEVSR